MHAHTAARNTNHRPAPGRWWHWKRGHLPDGLLNMITLSEQWAKQLAAKPETGMGYQVVSVVLKDGKRFDQVAIVGRLIAEIRGRADSRNLSALI